jgi:hypothetical protein
MILVGICLGLPILHYPWIASAKKVKLRWLSASITLATLAAVITLAIWVGWPPMHRHTLSEVERQKFEKPLRDFNHPKMSIHMYCAPNDEVNCEYAASLIPLFGESGWDVSGEVGRFILPRPEPGIIIAVHGSASPDVEHKLKWNEGEWTKVTPETGQVRKAFINIGIEPDSTSGSIIPENQINVYVGRERENESAPTDMTRAYENLERAERDHPDSTKGANK